MGEVSGLLFEGQPVAVCRKRCKRVILHVRAGGEIWVSAPRGVSRRRIAEILAERRDWLLAAVETQRARAPKPKRVCEGESFRLAGRALALRFAGGEIRAVGDELLVPPGTELSALRAWYVARAQVLFAERVALWAAAIGVTPGRVRAKEQRSRFGSCGIHGDINLCWRLVMEERALVDSVVIHELCHLLERNHSPAFWAQVARFDPQHRAHRAQLNKQSALWDW